MTALREAAQQALNALGCLEYSFCGITDGPSEDTTEAAITALKAALAEPVQEPVAWVECDGELVWNNREAAIGRNLYTAPPQRPAEPVQEPDYWQEEARRYAGNADYWRKRYEALAEPDIDPVAWLWQHRETGHTRVLMPDERTATDVAAAWDVVGPLYLAPPQRKPWVGLTEEERTDICDGYGANIHWRAFRAIEAKLQEKNT